jgi:hypothetical protein
LEVKKLLSELESLSDKYISKSQKKIKNRRLIYVALVCLVLGIIGFRLFQKLTFKTKQEQFVESVSDNYMDNYGLYAQSQQYKSDLSDFTTLFEESRLASNFTDKAIRDSVNAIWEQWENSNQISEFRLYAKASKCILNNDLNNAKLYIDTAIVLNPKFPAIYYLKSKTYSDPDSSIKLLSKAIELDSKISYVYLPYRCEAYASKGEFDKSLADINLYFDKYPKNRMIDLGRVVGRISILINMGLKEQGCLEFNKLDNSQRDNIKANMPDEYSQLVSVCS